jgi:hypothetical protein
MAKSDFWQKDQDEISRLNQQRATLKEIIDQWQKHYLETEDAKILAEMANEEDDQSTNSNPSWEKLMTEGMPSLLSTPVRVARSPRTGLRCFSGCIFDGVNPETLPPGSSTTKRVMRQASRV